MHTLPGGGFWVFRPRIFAFSHWRPEPPLPLLRTGRSSPATALTSAAAPLRGSACYPAMLWARRLLPALLAAALLAHPQATTEAAREAVAGAFEPAKPSEFGCRLDRSRLCSARNAAYLSGYAARRVLAVRTAADMDVFADDWTGEEASMRTKGSPFALSFGNTAKLCLADASVCVSAGARGNQSTAPFRWTEYSRSYEDGATVFDESAGTLNATAAALAESKLREAAAEARHSERGAWTYAPIMSCAEFLRRFPSATPSACLASRPGTSVDAFDPNVFLFGYFHVLYLPAGSISASFNFPPTRSASGNAVGKDIKDRGLLSVSYYIDSPESERLPCTSVESSPCALLNSRILAGRFAQSLRTCTSKPCLLRVLQDVNYGSAMAIGKGLASDFFYAYAATEEGIFVAHGGNPNNVGKNLGSFSDFGNNGVNAWASIKSQAAKLGGYGLSANYLWASPSCQQQPESTSCTVSNKVAQVFSVQTVLGTIVGGVGYNHKKPTFPNLDSHRDANSTLCTPDFALPCSDEVVRGLVSHVSSALSIYDPQEVFDAINAYSEEYKEGDFYVFVLEASTGLYFAHGAMNRLVTEGESLVGVAGSLGLSQEQLNGQELLDSMNAAVNDGSSSYVVYNWSTSQPGVIVEKLAYVAPFKFEGNGTTKDLIIGTGYSNILYEPPVPPGFDECPLNRNIPCARETVLAAAGLATVEFTVAAIRGGSAGGQEYLQRLSQGAVSKGPAVGVTFIHRYGMLLASSELSETKNVTWGVEYGELASFADVMSSEGRNVRSNDLLGLMLKTASAGGGWFPEVSVTTPTVQPTLGERMWFVSSLICNSALSIDGDDCAFVAADLLDYGCGRGSEMLESGECRQCSPGTFLNETTRRCEICPPGSFSSLYGKTECTRCKELPDAQMRYQNASGATLCNLCPKHTTRLLTKPATDVGECLCVEGTFQMDLLATGAECTVCRPGAECPGSNNDVNLRPYPKEGFWGLPDSPQKMLECDNAVACTGGVNFSCAIGYQGTLCADCEDGYYPFDDACIECASKDVQPLVTMAITGLVFLLWFGLNELPYQALEVGLEFMQVSDVIGKFDLDWGAAISVWQIFSNFANFDVDIAVPWICHIPWRSDHAFLLLMLLSWMKATFLGVVYVIRATTLRLVKTHRLKRSPRFLVTDQRYVDEGPSRILGDLLSFHHIMYLALAEKVRLPNFVVLSISPFAYSGDLVFVASFTHIQRPHTRRPSPHLPIRTLPMEGTSWQTNLALRGVAMSSVVKAFLAPSRWLSTSWGSQSFRCTCC